MATRYVVDASAIGHYLDPDIYTTEVTNLLAGLAQGTELYVPEFCLLECTNVLWKHVRFDGLPESDAQETISDLLQLPFQIVPIRSLLPRALQIGLNHQLAVYDSLYIALALDLNCPLITVDSRQAIAATASGVILKPITDFAFPNSQ